MELALLICGTIILLVLIISSYKKDVNSPMYKCLHTIVTVETYNGTRTVEYLSTCSKCGYQKRHKFKGLN